MNISPINNIRFGQYFHQNDFNNSQLAVVNKIEDALRKPVPSDNEGRSYERYLDAMGYDILAWSAKEKENGVKVFVLRQPVNEADKVRREYGEFTVYDEDLAGIYDEENPFDIKDVMKLYNDDIKVVKRSHALLLAMPLIYLAVTIPALWLISRLPGLKQKSPEAIEKTVQDTAKIVKDTIPFPYK